MLDDFSGKSRSREVGLKLRREESVVFEASCISSEASAMLEPQRCDGRTGRRIALSHVEVLFSDDDGGNTSTCVASRCPADATFCCGSSAWTSIHDRPWLSYRRRLAASFPLDRRRSFQVVPRVSRPFCTTKRIDGHVECASAAPCPHVVSSPDSRSVGPRPDHVTGRRRPGRATWRTFRTPPPAPGRSRDHTMVLGDPSVRPRRAIL